MPELGNRRQRGIGTEDAHAHEHAHRDSHVEREILVRRAVTEVIRRHGEEDGAHQRGGLGVGQEHGWDYGAPAGAGCLVIFSPA